MVKIFHDFIFSFSFFLCACRFVFVYFECVLKHVCFMDFDCFARFLWMCVFNNFSVCFVHVFCACVFFVFYMLCASLICVFMSVVLVSFLYMHFLCILCALEISLPVCALQVWFMYAFSCRDITFTKEYWSMKLQKSDFKM